ncbi:group III truncated hemoglobin [Oharaeibacter diazotrophicus]|uniref:Hemoglobin n=1 Tax=Oharaeibacter diazotrophicus TaxID=1920512 RepID=A0A4R6RN36_9HYPH|nr:group III truncated hemoglobin [Oharaeibacter diazotrophicus]TDP87467.1 hemoglobin [Oharaeibacter diazotrophicus]BBE70589.1 group 3 truncated hemoglobin ctb [Pleomorphomonas sp. SM30]GLS77335.1 preprotein translocase subunit TatC [Oharaeibacter diazotrophicus]
MSDDDLRVRAAGGPGFPRPPAGLSEDDIRALVHAFYDRIRADALLGPVFDAAIPDERWPVQLATMVDFWSGAVLRTDRYAGRPLPAHLALPGIGEAHFAHWLALFRRTAEDVLEPAAAAHFTMLAERIAHSFRLGIAFHRGEDSTRVAFLQAR